MDLCADTCADTDTDAARPLLARAASRDVANRPAASVAIAFENSFGGFVIGDMQLALPMAVLREVVPFKDVHALPSPAACVIGGIDLRGVVVPVVDLRVVLGRATERSPYPCVIVMVFDGKIMGLLVERVSGIFYSLAGSLKRISVTDPTAAVFWASVNRADDGAVVSVLSPAALTQLHQVPMVEDPEPARQLVAHDTDEVVVQDASVPMMLLRCSRVPLVVEAMVVHATLARPKVEPSVLAMGHCRGVIDYAGRKIAAIDLQSLCGLGQLDMANDPQAFVVSVSAGQVAFLVGEVVDVVRTLPDQVIHVPAFALPHPTLFAGALPTSVLSDELIERTGMAASQYLLIDAAELTANAEVTSLAAANTEGSSTRNTTATAFASGALQAAGQRLMITYGLAGETATPLEQVKEILPYSRQISIFKTKGALLGFLVNRDRSIPVYCLSRLTGGASPDVTPAVSVLVVESDGELVGFAVPKLVSIEPAQWEPELPDYNPGASGVIRSRQLAQVGAGDNQRMLPLLDLLHVARLFQSQVLAT